MYTKNVPNNPQPKLHGFEITLIQKEIESMWNLKLMKEIVRGQLLKSRLPRAGLIYEKFEGYLVHVFKNICFIEWKSEWKYVWMKKWVKIRIILFKNRKYVFKHIYQTVSWSLSGDVGNLQRNFVRQVSKNELSGWPHVRVIVWVNSTVHRSKHIPRVQNEDRV